MKRTGFRAISLVAVFVFSVVSIGLRPITAYANGAEPIKLDLKIRLKKYSSR